MDFSQIAKNIPNLITLARMLMTPVAVAMIVSDRYLPAFLTFLLAGVSDGVDGFIASRFHLRTELGAYLDPLADKALLISIYVALAIYGERVEFRAGEALRLFFSYRFTPEKVERLLSAHRLELEGQWLTKSGEEGVFACRAAAGKRG